MFRFALYLVVVLLASVGDTQGCGDYNLLNGYVEHTGTGAGDNATLYCHEGYTLHGDTVVTCNGTDWSGTSNCTAVDCGSVTVTDGTVHTPSGTTFDEVALVQCTDGYTLIGSPLITCQSNQSWSPVPTCSIKECGDPSPLHGTRNTTEETYDSAVLISCDDGYELYGSSTIICQSDGTWSDQPTCHASDCGTYVLFNGEITLSGGTTYGETAALSCSAGYILVGSSTVTCDVGGWNDTANCTAVDCNDLEIANATVNAPVGTTFEEVAIVKCLEGYDISGSTLVSCKADGYWSEQPTCTIKECGDPTPQNGKRSSMEEFYNTSVLISCNDGYELYGISTIICQSDGTWSDRPTCHATDCGTYVLVNGEVSLNGGTTYGENATLTCNTGYNLVGSITVTCDVGGWNGTANCTAVDCNDLEIANATVNAPVGTTFGEVAIVKCLEGYEISGSTLVSCRAGGSWSEEPTCTIKDCGDPTPLNGKRSSIEESYNTSVLISCDVGYELYGISSIICQSDGTWSDRPTCHASDCGTYVLVNGEVSLTGGTTFGENATLTCNTGYNLVGGITVTCDVGGWNGTANCTAIDCDDLVIANATVNAPVGTRFGEVAIVKCLEGYEISGSSLVSCNADGSWSEQPTCTIKECGDPTPLNGKRSNTDESYNSSVLVSCDDGYELYGISSIICQSDGTWSDRPTCHASDCGTYVLVNGEVSLAGGTYYGENATLTCNDGYNLVGSMTVRCDVGGWNGTANCTAVDCNDLEIANAIVNAPVGTTFREVAIVKCLEGYKISGSTLVSCTADGSWSEQPTCTIKDCGDPTPENGKRSSMDEFYNTSVIISCNDGYELYGISTIICQSDGTWSDRPTCHASDCGTYVLVNGEVSLTGGTTYGENATLACNTGYNLVGSSTVMCDVGGWNGTANCTALDCQNLEIANATVNAPVGTTFGEVAIVKCFEGYEISGSTLVSCRADGNWSEQPTCSIIECGDPTPLNGKRSSMEEIYNTSVLISCNDGYELYGISTIICQSDGIWSDRSTCHASDCGTYVLVNGEVSLNGGTTYGENATLNCNTGYNLIGSITVTCDVGGWNGSANCTAVDCNNLEIANATVNAPVGTTFGEVAIVKCQEGYVISGSSLVSCRADGTWSEQPTCTIIECGDPTPLNGKRSSTEETYNTSQLISCDDGYELYGISTIICQSDGTWSDRPTCHASDCGTYVLVNGEVSFNGGTTYGENATLTCNTGYNLVGSMTVTCDVGGWNGTANCTAIDCNDLEIANATVNAPVGTTFGEVAIVRCNEGYEISGSTLVSCRADGSWREQPTCTITECGDPTPLNGKRSTLEEFYNTSVMISCDDGYELYGISTIICQSDGTWSDRPTCHNTDCGTYVLVNGKVSLTEGTTFGENATLTCNTGYNLVGSNTVTCDVGGWNGTANCTAVDCYDLDIPNATVNAPVGTTFGEVAIVKCLEGFEISGSTLVSCRADGGWSEQPTCTIKECGDPTPPNGKRSSMEESYNSSVLISCDDGYELYGISTIICQSDGTWSDRPTCRASDCGTYVLVNGEVSLTGGTTYGENATLTCNAGYDLVGNINVICDVGGWNGTANCTAVDCYVLEIANATVNAPVGTTFGEVAIVSCLEGYDISGSTLVSCKADGNWSEQPMCTIKECGDPTPLNGKRSSMEESYNTSVLISCDNGYELYGISTIICQSDGSWSDRPTCHASDCGTYVLANGEVSVTGGTTYGENATLICNSGYNLVGSITVTCDVGGWNATANCTAVDCNNLEIENATVNAPAGTTFGEVAIVKCLEGYEISGSTLVSCKADGNWSEQPTCTIKECGDPTPLNGKRSSIEESYNTSVMISCDDGYELYGISTIICQSDGIWSDRPTCHASDCGTYVLVNGEVSLNGGTTYGENTTLTCNTGYNLVGSTTVTCDVGGWNGTANCTAVDCNDLEIVNATVNAPVGTTFGEVAIVKCVEGYRISGSTLVSCKADGNWSGQPTCTIKECGDPTPLNGQRSSMVESYNTSVTISCDDGYELYGNSDILCQSDGIWSDRPTCHASDCGTYVLVNGEVSLTGGTSYGGNATLTCNAGYNLVGSTTVTCDVGGWSGTANCTAVDCNDLEIANATVNAPVGTTFGEVAIVKCLEGYEISGSTLVSCQADGNWSEPPTCTIKECGDPTPLNGKRSNMEESYNTSVLISCDNGYELYGIASITCQSDGTWSDRPTCHASDCGSYVLVNGEVSVIEGTTYGKNATLICNAGYNLVGSTIVTCDVGGWNGTANCTAIDCNDLEIANATVNAPVGTTFGEVAIVNCLEGYEISGSTLVSCKEDGNWSEQPTCTIRECGDPTPPNGKRSNMEEYYNTSVLITCDDGFELYGISNIICQSDGTWSGRPTCHASDCGTYVLVNGEVSLNGGTTYGENLTLTCSTGYNLVGSITVTCDVGGWNGTANCTAVDCNDLEIANAIVNAPVGTTFGEVAIVKCLEGYRLSGNTLVSCKADGNWSEEPTCTIKECGDPTPTNGKRSSMEESYNTSVLISCDDGYELYGISTIICQLDGTWSDRPTCHASNCGTYVLVNGEVSLTGGTTYGENATLACNAGYNLVGSMTVTCDVGGWNGTANCTAVDCNELEIANATVNAPVGTTFGEVAIVKCLEGYELSGSTLVSCKADGNWNEQPTCTIKECGDPTPLNGKRSSMEESYNTSVLISCNDGYELYGISTIICQSDGTWSDRPTCHAIDCGTYVLVNGEVSLTGGTTYGENATPTCNAGYSLVGSTTVICDVGGWNGTANCTAVGCNNLEIANATVHAPVGTTFGEVAIVNCLEGYEMSGNNLVSCKADGNWSEQPTCTVKECGDPTPLNGKRSSTEDSYNTSVLITCDDGYELYGISTIICQSDGTWSDQPTCHASDCGTYVLVNGEVSMTGGTTYGENATLTCNTGYSLVGSSTVTCDVDGWNGTANCIAVDCNDLEIANATVNAPAGTTFGEVAIVKCFEGYKISGSTLVSCKADGNWSEQPTCMIKECGDPTPLNGRRSNMEESYNTSVLISCNDGYELYGISTISCQSDGTWSDRPTCHASDCGTYVLVNGEVSLAGGTTYRENATLTCNAGYNLVGSFTVTCDVNGWNGTANCTTVDCNDLEIANATTNAPVGTTFGEVAIVKCLEGYEISGNTLVSCNADGNWTEQPTCKIKECGDPTPLNGKRSSMEESYNSSVLISCNDGYELYGISTIICQPDGTWSDRPTCHASDCGIYVLVNGEVSMTGGTTYGENATLTCNAGYTLVGSNIVTCDVNGWNGTANCAAVDCNDLEIANATVNAPVGTTFGEVAIVICLEGYEISGSTLVSCKSDGNWSEQPICTIKECGDPTPLNGKRNSIDETYNTSVFISCDDGYELYGISTIICKSDGTWSDRPTCHASDCGTYVFVNGEVSLTGGTTYGENATLTCNTGYNLVGSTTVSCDVGGWNGTANCTAIDCNDLEIANASVNAPVGTTFGEVAIVKCIEGYEISGSTLVSCKADGTWSEQPTCTIKECGDPTPLNGKRSNTEELYNTTVLISCDDGYELYGISTIICQADGTWSDQPTCHASDCGTYVLVNGEVSLTGRTSYGENATLICNDGYSLVGSITVTCDVGGWNGTANCTAVDCNDLEIANATVNSPAGTTYGEVAIVKCIEGYEISGSTLVACKEDGNWSEQPTCTIRECGDPTPLNGKRSSTEESYNTSVLISCDDGYELYGTSTINCQSDGTWSDRPTCHASDCGTYVLVNGEAFLNGGTTFGENATLACNAGYNLIGSITVICDVGGWNGTTNCSAVDCGDLEISNATVNSPAGTTFGEVAIVKCLEGYTISGSTLVSCRSDGNWSEQPTCSIKECGDPTPQNGKRSNIQESYNTSVVIICDDGYELYGISTIICQSDGTWSDRPTCHASDCGTYVLVNGEVYVTGGTTYGENATLTCNAGYILDGNSTVTCDVDGWYGTASCVTVDCGDPSPVNGTAKLPIGTRYGAVAIMICDDGYILQGEKYVACNTSGLWNSYPTCLRDCGDPSPSNGQANISSGTTFGETATVLCNPGYDINGLSNLKCQHTGWDDLPTCDVKDCGDPAPENGSAYIPTGTTYGATASISCDDGYILQGQEHITCEDTGTWSANSTCLRDCGDPTPNNGQATTSSGTTFGGTAVISCNPGYYINGTPTLTCQHTGWSDIPTCDIKDCGDPTPINGSAYISTNTKYSATALISCDRGNILQGDEQITCEDSGTWSINSTCLFIDCGDPSPANGSAYLPTGTRYEDTAFISCDSGYILQGQEHITCKESGTWSVNSTCLRDCSDPTPVNGQANISSGTTFSETAEVTCNAGYTINGSATLTCNHIGWGDIPACNIKDCGDPSPSNGSASIPSGTTYGETAFITCDDGYIFQGDEHITCQGDGTWSFNTTCLRDCGDPTPVNGQADISSGTTFGETAGITCNAGYILNGSDTLTCEHIGWGDIPTCNIKDCGDPSPINGSASIPSGTTHRETAFITCDDGYILQGDEHIICQDDGTWSFNTTCLRDCGDPTPVNGQADISLGTTFGVTAVITCNAGYSLNGNSSLTCQHSDWGEIPTCDIIDCGDPSPANGSVYLPTGTRYEDTAFISCDSGYTLQGQEHIICEDSGTWSVNSTCLRDCGDPAPVNGQADISSGTTFGVTAEITCNAGYTLNGSANLTCKHVGWGDIPTCNIKDCGDPSPNNGSANIPSGSTYGETAFITCDYGYILQGDEQIICQDDGTWNFNTTCLRDCGDPTPVNGQADISSGTTFGETAEITCNAGYSLNGSNTLTCIHIGWGDIPTCNIKDCGDPSPSNGSANIPSGTTYDEAAFITCDDGYILQGNEHIICKDDGTWSFNTTCLRDCGDPTPVNGQADISSGTTFGETAKIACNAGYILNGSDTLTCEHTGWDDIPTCNIKDCGDPSPHNGSANTPSGTTYDEAAFITCDDGYIRQGDEHIICKDDGTWSFNTTCLRDCGDPTPLNGQADISSGTTFSETAKIACNAGYILNGSDTLTCEHTGWDDIPTCNIKDCGDPSPHNGSANTPRGTTYDETAFITCDDGYILQGDEHIICKDDGTWSFNTTCLRDCGDPTPLNGQADISSGTTFGETAKITCNAGYILNGSDTLTCEHTGWDDIPTCNIKDCGDPSPNNGSANIPSGTTYDEAAYITCDDGYILQGDEHIICKDDGTWSFNTTCLRDCGDPTPVNGQADISSGTTFGVTAVITCNPGYTVNGTFSVTCQHTGWGEIPTCDIIDCGDPTPNNGSANIPTGTTYSEAAYISCNSGFTLQGFEHIICREDGSWSFNTTCVLAEPVKDKTFNFETTLAFGIVLGCMTCAAFTAASILIYKKRCSQPNLKNKPVDEDEFDNVSNCPSENESVISEIPDYPPILLAHPPPGTRNTLPRIVKHRDNVNVVTPLTQTQAQHVGKNSVDSVHSTPVPTPEHADLEQNSPSSDRHQIQTPASVDEQLPIEVEDEHQLQTSTDEQFNQSNADDSQQSQIAEEEIQERESELPDDENYYASETSLTLNEALPQIEDISMTMAEPEIFENTELTTPLAEPEIFENTELTTPMAEPEIFENTELTTPMAEPEIFENTELTPHDTYPEGMPYSGAHVINVPSNTEDSAIKSNTKQGWDRRSLEDQDDEVNDFNQDLNALAGNNELVYVSEYSTHQAYSSENDLTRSTPISFPSEQNIPSVEDVTPDESSPAFYNDSYADSFLSDPKLPVVATAKPTPKSYMPATADTLKTVSMSELRRSNSNVSFGGQQNAFETDEKPNPRKRSRASGPARKPELSSHIPATYGGTPKEAIKAYNPSVSRQHTVSDSLGTEQKKMTEIREAKRKRNVRVNAMLDAYGETSPLRDSRKKYNL